MGTVSGGKDGRRYIPVHDLCSSLSHITCQNLPSFHALTGCDTTSTFFWIGKNMFTKSWKHHLKSCLIWFHWPMLILKLQWIQQNMHYLCYAIQRENSSRVIMTFTCCWSNWQQAKTLCFLVFHLVNHPLSNMCLDLAYKQQFGWHLI